MENDKFEIFELALLLARALDGDKKVIFDIELFYEKNPHMFNNIENLIDILEGVLPEDLIILQDPDSLKYGYKRSPESCDNKQRMAVREVKVKDNSNSANKMQKWEFERKLMYIGDKLNNPSYGSWGNALREVNELSKQALSSKQRKRVEKIRQKIMLGNIIDKFKFE